MKDLVADARTRVSTVSPADAMSAAGEGALILDVREPAELESNGRVAGALNVPRGILETRADESMPTAEASLVAQKSGGTVHVLCASGGRAALAADTLRGMGYEATIIEGGIQGWISAGLPVEG
ncbi:rhodanese-like domain-containing protein [Pelagovum pacificum]|uniref:Sulfurtransferase n=2 Tax=Pelagovum pacificum TaxID=2588711 RepID=A0A5C5GHW5_9RHOB|nr:rhodanese-like domain-containing protein [Pelagovum pacificum]QQA43398.1 rhodanese-like domain-containing protein [Pelagovum pacificum]TNY34362.1 sulfurtransferase [Pelagovum pacificum]